MASNLIPPLSANCAKCGSPIDERLDEPGHRSPCPVCGSTTRNLEAALTETMKLHDSLRFRHKNSSGRKLADGFSGDDLQVSTGIWMRKDRLIDWFRNLYQE